MRISSIAISALAGVAGAVAVVLLHRALRGSRFRRSPHPQLPEPGTLRDVRLAGGLISGGLYYGLTGVLGRDRALATGALLGVAAGVGSVMLPVRLGLRTGTENRPETQALEVGTYATGGLVAGATYRLLGG